MNNITEITFEINGCHSTLPETLAVIKEIREAYSTDERCKLRVVVKDF